MKKEQAIKVFSQLGTILNHVVATALEGAAYPGDSIGVSEVTYDKLHRTINQQVQYNGWFTKLAVCQSLQALSNWLKEDQLSKWLEKYAYADNPKRVGIIMAGNIPLVGFHDFLCTILSGNIAVCKMSSEDKMLLPQIATILAELQPEISKYIVITDGKIGQIDAVIATGSNNSLLYFEQYFGKYPHIFRKNRTSIAVLDGTETEQDFYELGKDIFTYFGLGCRNVSHLLVPKDYKFDSFFQGIYPHNDIINHFKYGNNYDYNKTVYLMNKSEMLDNNFVLLLENEQLHSPLAMVYYHQYESQADIDQYIAANEHQLQVIVGKNYTPFGQAQCPKLNDYADGIDTMTWLNNL